MTERPVASGPVASGPVASGHAGAGFGLLTSTAPLLAWFAVSGRDLPWRKSRDPWPILVCELMAQQTQVSRVVERLPGFLQQFPNPTALANQPVGAVIQAWTGLGYNRRAVNLHRAAAWIRDEHDGRIPSNRTELLNLPGVGPYTARAVRVFAFEYDDGVVDTNIARVLARLGNRRLKASEVQLLADDLVPVGESWAWNQALMEVGALLCRSEPTCGDCPLQADCRWHAAKEQDAGLADPAKHSAKVSTKQNKFEGSDRQGRGRLVKALAASPVGLDQLASAMGWPDHGERATQVANTVVADGLAVFDGQTYRLPG